jgi:hypothetical protein
MLKPGHGHAKRDPALAEGGRTNRQVQDEWRSLVRNRHGMSALCRSGTPMIVLTIRAPRERGEGKKERKKREGKKERGIEKKERGFLGFSSPSAMTFGSLVFCY